MKSKNKKDIVKKSQTICLVTKWGIAIVNPITNFWIDWDNIRNFINNEQYIVSIWLFRNLDKMIKGTKVVLKPHGVKTVGDAKAIIKKVEQIKHITISDDKKEEIIDAMKNAIKKKEPIFHKTTI